MRNDKQIERDILGFLRNNGHRSFRPKEIARKLSYDDNRDYLRFRSVLSGLVDEGRIGKLKGGRVCWRSSGEHLEGIIRVHPDGYGFVSVEDGQNDYFVRARRMQNALDGDRVAIAVSAPSNRDGRRQAEVLRVISRGRTEAVGTYREYGSFNVVHPDDLRLTHDIYVSEQGDFQPEDGDKVVVSIDAFEDRHAAPRGRILNVLGPSTHAGIRTLALALSCGVRAEYPSDALEEANAAESSISESERTRREDFRERITFTIDPEDARDFDDALHVVQLKNGLIEIGVHIADVSHFVCEGSALDREAEARGTSVYLVDQAIHMLPVRLSSDICSLNPDEDRLTFSCILTFRPDGTVVDRRLSEGVIRSRHRLTYAEAQKIISDPDHAHALSQPIQTAWTLSRALFAHREERGSIDFDLPEIRVILDADGRPSNIVQKTRLDAHRLIEEFMLQANRAVAEMMDELPDLPFIFRIHEHPDREKIRELASWIRAFGLELPHTDGAVNPRALNALLNTIRGRPEGPVIRTAVLRSMARARYSTDNRGHFGLALSQYTHFTSPIRRYPDLVVHRLAKKALSGTGKINESTLERICNKATEREAVATEAERATTRLMQVEYAVDHIGESFSGVVTGASRFGLYVNLESLLVEGMIHVRDLPDDYYEYNEQTFSLSGRRSRRRFRPGDRLFVQIAAARPDSREIDLVLGEEENAGNRRFSRRRG